MKKLSFNSMSGIYKFFMVPLRVSMLLLFLSFTMLAQQNVQINIKGKVTNKESGEPLEYVSVFLTNTTIGTNTGKDGEFAIKNAPPGNYDLIFSYVGFETHKEHIEISEHTSLNFDIALVPKPLHFNQIDIVEQKQSDWDDNLEKFKNIFLGETDNVDDTKILNPEVIKFKVDKKAGILKAYADSVLRIENKSLGYTVYVVLDSLIYNKTDESIKLIDYSRFQELKPTSKDDSLDWNKNRIETFRNSPRYFFYQLVHKKLYKKEFKLYSGTIYDLLNREGTPIDGNELELTSNKDSTIFELSYKGSLKVKRSSQISVLSFYKPVTAIDKFGNFLKPYFTVEIYGYWGKQGVADALPLNYVYKE